MTRMRRTAGALALALLAVAASGGAPAGAAVPAQPALAVADAWVAPPSPGATTATLYASLSNLTMYDAYVMGGSTDAAATVELRDGDAAAPTLTVPAYGALELKPGGPRVVLLNLTRSLRDGETVDVMLTIDGGPPLRVPAVVKTP